MESQCFLGHLCSTSSTLLIKKKRKKRWGCWGSVTCPKLHTCQCRRRTPTEDLLPSLHPALVKCLLCQAQCSTVLPKISCWTFMINPGIRHFIILTLHTRRRRMRVFRGLTAAKFQKQKQSINSLTLSPKLESLLGFLLNTQSGVPFPP